MYHLERKCTVSLSLYDFPHKLIELRSPSIEEVLLINGLPASIRGALWMMGSMASWACMAAIARYFTGEIHTFEIVFFRSLFGGMFLLPWLFKVGLGGLKTRRIGMHLMRGFTGLAVIYLSLIHI